MYIIMSAVAISAVSFRRQQRISQLVKRGIGCDCVYFRKIRELSYLTAFVKLEPFQAPKRDTSGLRR